MNRTALTTPRTAAIAAGLVAASLLGTACAAQGADAAKGTASSVTTPSAAVPFVANHFGEENADSGRPERRPRDLVLSEFTTINRVSWEQWGPDKAVGSGFVTGTWCLDTCADKPLKATISLSDPKEVNGKPVYSAFTLELSGTPGAYDSEDLDGKRPLAIRETP